MASIIERIERELGIPGLASALVGCLEPSDLQSLLLEVQRLNAMRKSASSILSQYAANRFVRVAADSPQELAEWDQVAFSNLPAGFTALELSPVCPLGTCSVVARVSQNWSVATVRNTEVVSDSTNVLALEAAIRRRELLSEDSRSPQPVHLAASQRLLRAQKYEDADLVSHFRLFALCSAGRDAGSSRFEAETLRVHVGFYLSAIRAFVGRSLHLRVTLTEFGHTGTSSVRQTVESATAHHDNVSFALDPDREAGYGYYCGACFHVFGEIETGMPVQLADGGVVDWTQRYLSNAKERLIVSGIGARGLVKSGTRSTPSNKRMRLARPSVAPYVAACRLAA